MSSLTFLGASGGAGTTTLASVSVHLLAEHGLPVPAIVAEQAAVFNVRLGTPVTAAQSSSDELIDGGRYSAPKASAALTQGRLVLVGAATHRGIDALNGALDDLAEHEGASSLDGVIPVLCASFRAAPALTEGGHLVIPYDRALAQGGSLSDAFPRVGRRTRAALASAWLSVLRESFNLR